MFDNADRCQYEPVLMSRSEIEPASRRQDADFDGTSQSPLRFGTPRANSSEMDDVASTAKRGPIKRAAIRIMQVAPAIFNPLWKIYYPLFVKYPYYRGRKGDRSSIFVDIYQDNSWGSEESRSGPGSTLAYTAPLRKALPRIFEQFNVRSLLDAPCGDFHWMRHVPLRGIQYIGADIVPELIHNLSGTYCGDGIHFRVLDVVEDELPAADMWLCRDVLFHLPNSDIMKVLDRFAKSNIKYLVSSTYKFTDENLDIGAGGFRCINLEAWPYNLPKPLRYIEDFVAPFPPRYLGVWSRDQIAKALSESTSAPAGPTIP